jgi:hypothetical protein
MTPRVTKAVAEQVISRDLRVAGGCVAAYLGATTPCRARWGSVVKRSVIDALTLDHIREQPGGERRSEARWLVSICWGHHLIDAWATAHRPEIRDYLEKVSSLT